MTNTPTRLGAHIPLIYHFAMLQDQLRMENFKAAIDQSVKPGARVLELGGGTGVLSYFAAQHASKVYCVERIPGNAQAARKLLDDNGCSDRVEVICADAFGYLPPEPVDVVICEMLHVGMVREQQIQIIRSFKARYRERFGEKLPMFIPEAFIQAIQPIEYDFNFFGYRAPVPVFQAPGVNDHQCKELGDPAMYQFARYEDELMLNIWWSGSLPIKQNGKLNAVRFVLKNILGTVPSENRAIHWHNQYLVLPLIQPLDVRSGEHIHTSLEYQAGCEIDDLRNGLSVASETKVSELRSQIEISTYTPLEAEPPPFQEPGQELPNADEKRPFGLEAVEK